MPIDKSKYPKNWKQLATEIKAAANWTCQQCGRPCRRPEQSWPDFVALIAKEHHEYYAETSDEVSDDSGLSTIIERPQRFTLTVAHLDHNTQNNHQSNLRALCSDCHLRYDVELHRANASATRYRKKEERGQLHLFQVSGGPE